MISDTKQDECPFYTDRPSYLLYCRAQQLGLNSLLSLNQISLGSL